MVNELLRLPRKSHNHDAQPSWCPKRRRNEKQTMTNKTYNKTCVTSKDSNQPVHPSSMARVLVHPSLDSPEAVEGTCVQRRLWSDCADAQADLSLRWSRKSYCRFIRNHGHTNKKECNIDPFRLCSFLIDLNRQCSPLFLRRPCSCRGTKTWILLDWNGHIFRGDNFRIWFASLF